MKSPLSRVVSEWIFAHEARLKRGYDAPPSEETRRVFGWPEDEQDQRSPRYAYVQDYFTEAQWAEVAALNERVEVIQARIEARAYRYLKETLRNVGLDPDGDTLTIVNLERTIAWLRTAEVWRDEDDDEVVALGEFYDDEVLNGTLDTPFNREAARDFARWLVGPGAVLKMVKETSEKTKALNLD